MTCRAREQFWQSSVLNEDMRTKWRAGWDAVFLYSCKRKDFRLLRHTALYARVMYIAWNITDNNDTSASVFVVQFNGFMSLTSDFDVTYNFYH